MAEFISHDNDFLCVFSYEQNFFLFSVLYLFRVNVVNNVCVWLFQLQEEPITAASKRSKYHSLRQAVSVIRRDEGKAAFWKGHVPAQALSLVFGVVQVCASTDSALVIL